MTEIYCFECGQSISSVSPVFYYCDAPLCSLKCSNLRKEVIANIDPNFSNPVSWKKMKPALPIKSLFNSNKPNKPSISLTRTKSSHIIHVIQNNDLNEKSYFHKEGFVIYIATGLIFVMYRILNNI